MELNEQPPSNVEILKAKRVMLILQYEGLQKSIDELEKKIKELENK